MHVPMHSLHWFLLILGRSGCVFLIPCKFTNFAKIVNFTSKFFDFSKFTILVNLLLLQTQGMLTTVARRSRSHRARTARQQPPFRPESRARTGRAGKLHQRRLQTVAPTSGQTVAPTSGPPAGGWLFLLAPRMQLSRLHGQAQIPPAEIERRASLLRAGEWAPAGARSGPPDSLEARGERAAALAHVGELSAAARALMAEPLAPSNEETLRELRDPARRPQSPRAPIPEAVLQHQPHEPVRLSWGAFVGCTNENLRLLLDSEEDMQLLHHAAQRLALADVPEVIATALRLGRMVALRKPNGRVRGLVMGDASIPQLLALPRPRRVPHQPEAASERKSKQAAHPAWHALQRRRADAEGCSEVYVIEGTKTTLQRNST